MKAFGKTTKQSTSITQPQPQPNLILGKFALRLLGRSKDPKQSTAKLRQVLATHPSAPILPFKGSEQAATTLYYEEQIEKRKNELTTRINRHEKNKARYENQIKEHKKRGEKSESQIKKQKATGYEKMIQKETEELNRLTELSAKLSDSSNLELSNHSKVAKIIQNHPAASENLINHLIYKSKIAFDNTHPNELQDIQDTVKKIKKTQHELSELKHQQDPGKKESIKRKKEELQSLQKELKSSQKTHHDKFTTELDTDLNTISGKLQSSSGLSRRPKFLNSKNGVLADIKKHDEAALKMLETFSLNNGIRQSKSESSLKTLEEEKTALEKIRTDNQAEQNTLNNKIKELDATLLGKTKDTKEHTEISNEIELKRAQLKGLKDQADKITPLSEAYEKAINANKELTTVIDNESINYNPPQLAKRRVELEDEIDSALKKVDDFHNNPPKSSADDSNNQPLKSLAKIHPDKLLAGLHRFTTSKTSKNNNIDALLLPPIPPKDFGFKSTQISETFERLSNAVNDANKDLKKLLEQSKINVNHLTPAEKKNYDNTERQLREKLKHIALDAVHLHNTAKPLLKSNEAYTKDFLNKLRFLIGHYEIKLPREALGNRQKLLPLSYNEETINKLQQPVTSIKFKTFTRHPLSGDHRKDKKEENRGKTKHESLEMPPVTAEEVLHIAADLRSSDEGKKLLAELGVKNVKTTVKNGGVRFTIEMEKGKQKREDISKATEGVAKYVQQKAQTLYAKKDKEAPESNITSTSLPVPGAGPTLRP